MNSFPGWPFRPTASRFSTPSKKVSPATSCWWKTSAEKAVAPKTLSGDIITHYFGPEKNYDEEIALSLAQAGRIE
jgi:hypothetical protein